MQKLSAFCGLYQFLKPMIPVPGLTKGGKAKKKMVGIKHHVLWNVMNVGPIDFSRVAQIALNMKGAPFKAKFLCIMNELPTVVVAVICL